MTQDQTTEKRKGIPCALFYKTVIFITKSENQKSFIFFWMIKLNLKGESHTWRESNINSRVVKRIKLGWPPIYAYLWSILLPLGNYPHPGLNSPCLWQRPPNLISSPCLSPSPCLNRQVCRTLLQGNLTMPYYLRHIKSNSSPSETSTSISPTSPEREKLCLDLYISNIRK